MHPLFNFKLTRRIFSKRAQLMIIQRISNTSDNNSQCKPNNPSSFSRVIMEPLPWYLNSKIPCLPTHRQPLSCWRLGSYPNSYYSSSSLSSTNSASPCFTTSSNPQHNSLSKTPLIRLCWLNSSKCSNNRCRYNNCKRWCLQAVSYSCRIQH